MTTLPHVANWHILRPVGHTVFGELVGPALVGNEPRSVGVHGDPGHEISDDRRMTGATGRVAERQSRGESAGEGSGEVEIIH